MVKEKNKLLSSFIQSSVNREQHKSPSQQNINNWKSVDVPLGVESVNDSIEVNSVSTIKERFNVSISTDEDSNYLASPECLSFDTPLKHPFERKHSTIDQLSDVRKEKHNQYMAFRGEKNVSVNTVNESFSPVCPVNNKYYSQGSVKDQLSKVRIDKQSQYSHFCRENKSENIESPKKWIKGTTLIIGDSMLYGINEERLSGKRKHNIKVRVFPGATVDDMYDILKPLIGKSPKNIILHVGTNNTPNETSRSVLNKLLALKSFIEKELPESKVIISNIINRFDNAKATLTVSRLNEHLNSLKLDVIDNRNISIDLLGKKGLHLNSKGVGKLALNLI